MDQLVPSIDFQALSANLKANIAVQDRSYWCVKYPKTFTGSDAIRYLTSYQEIATTKEAITIGNSLIENGLIYNVFRDTALKNDDSWYRFSSDEKHKG
jgi:hypothetical protein